MLKLCVNIDHIATIREVRKATEPDPLTGAKLAIEAGANGITVHLREDRRHINDRDVLLLSQLLKEKNSTLSPQPLVLFNLEMAATSEMFEIASKVKPDLVTLVPEKRQELTTEGGLDVIAQEKFLKDYLKNLHRKNLTVSIFINPDLDQIQKAKEIGSDFIEVHTGSYANEPNKKELHRVKEAIAHAQKIGLKTNAGHGLNYENIIPIAQVRGIEQLHIGHSIISKAVLVGIKEAIFLMKTLINKAQESTKEILMFQEHLT